MNRVKTQGNRVLNFSLAVLLALTLTACGGGGGGSPAPGAPPAPLDTGGGGVTLTPIQDPVQGGSVSASFSSAVAINDTGRVIGFAETALGSEFRAAVWTVDASGTATLAPSELKPLGVNTFSAAFGVDSSGNVVGQSSDGSAFVAVLWRNGVAEPERLPALATGGFSSANGISPDGRWIVGEAEDAGFVSRAVVWPVTAGVVGAPSVLPETFAAPTVAGAFAAAYGVNNSGWVVGEVEDDQPRFHAVIWRPLTSGGYSLIDLRGNGEEGSSGFGINALFQVVGESEATPGNFVPMLWTADATGEYKPTTLSNAGTAVAINNVGRIVGWNTLTPLAAIWDSAAPATAVNLFTTDSQAFGINNDNLVVGRTGSQGFIKRAN